MSDAMTQAREWMTHSFPGAKLFDNRVASLARLLTETRTKALSEKEAENARLREALEDIESSHLPDQPADSMYDERGWAMMWIGRLRGIAKEALKAERVGSGGDNRT